MTPWLDYEIPFEEAAEFGTRKVISDHSTIGLVILTDGSITDIPRRSYVPAEERVIEELRDLGKPFAAVLNSTHPWAQETVDLAKELTERYGVPVIPMDCLRMDMEDVLRILREVLYEFPVREVSVRLLSGSVRFQKEHWLRQQFQGCVGFSCKGSQENPGYFRYCKNLQPRILYPIGFCHMDLGYRAVVIDLDTPREFSSRLSVK